MRHRLAIGFLCTCACGRGDAGDTDVAAGLEPGWNTRASLPSPRADAAVVALDGRVYVIGGWSDQLADEWVQVDVYDPAADAWTVEDPLPEQLRAPNVAVYDGRIYVLGARSDGSVWIYEPGAGWQAGEPMPAGTERGAAAVGVVGERIYVAGGIGSNGSSTGTFSAYVPATDTWETELPELPRARDSAAGAVIEGVLYVAGGYVNVPSGTGLRDHLDAYDPEQGVWTALSPLPTAVAAPAGAVVDGQLFVLGGATIFDSAAGWTPPATQVYAPALDAWETRETMLTPRHRTGAAVVDGAVYVPGGMPAPPEWEPVSTVEAYVP